MRYIAAVVLPVLLQCLFVYIVIEMNTGNGSWLGLGALLIGMFAIPATAIINFLIVKSGENKNSFSIVGRCFLVAAVAPLLTPLLMLIG